ncbi:MAG: DUF4097 family beta strand repeat-containing protein [Lysinibacillus sp.]
MIKKLSIFAALLIVVGIVGSFLTYESEQIQAMDFVETVDVSNIDDITISTVSTDVIIETSKTATEATIELIGKAKPSQFPNLTVDTRDNELVIDVEMQTEKQWFDFKVNFEFYNPSLQLVIVLPEKDYEHLDLSTVSGDVVIENITIKDNVISTVSGDVETTKFIGKHEVSTTSGDVNIMNDDISHPVTVDSVSGDVYIIVAKQPKNATFSFDTISGDTLIFDKDINNFNFGDGSINVNVETISGDIEVSE